MSMEAMPVYSVTQVNRYVKGMMDGDALLSSLLVRGELSNYKCHSSGHHYFTLKDEGGALHCAMFRSDAVRLRFRPANGMKVLALGRVSVYPRDGQYQLYCQQLMPEGVGDLHAAFEALKKKLAEEGLFEPEHKKPIPAVPERVALVTSPTGAAVRDLLRILAARWPMARVVVVPARVQGEGAAAEIAAGLDRVNREKLADVIITGRGGGSMEDLWAFNEEIVARAIYRSKIPVISAVGHEPDVTISDYVADLRAATPSNAAELAVPDVREVRRRLAGLEAAMVQAVDRRLSGARGRLDELAHRRVLSDLRAPLEDRQQRLDRCRQRLCAAARSAAGARRAELRRLCAALDALSPLRVLGRGYAIARTEEGVLTSVDQAELGDRVQVRLTDGGLICTVMGKEKTPWRKKS